MACMVGGVARDAKSHGTATCMVGGVAKDATGHATATCMVAGVARHRGCDAVPKVTRLRGPGTALNDIADTGLGVLVRRGGGWGGDRCTCGYRLRP